MQDLIGIHHRSGQDGDVQFTGQPFNQTVISRKTGRLDNGVDHFWLVFGNDADGVARRISKARTGKRKFDVERLLVRTGTVEVHHIGDFGRKGVGLRIGRRRAGKVDMDHAVRITGIRFVQVA